MKKFVTLLVIASMFAGNVQAAAPAGQGAARSSQNGESFGWAVGLGGLAAIGVVVGVVAATASQSNSTFSH